MQSSRNLGSGKHDGHQNSASSRFSTMFATELHGLQIFLAGNLVDLIIVYCQIPGELLDKLHRGLPTKRSR
jgi:hypothetical protein